MKRLNCVDVVKFLMAFSVVTIHLKYWFDRDYPALIDWFVNLANPFFFMASGFITARKLNAIGSNSEKTEY